jgi:hypothetical protein
VQVDASGAAAYIFGDGGAKLDGVIEVSIDDPNFGSPRIAMVGDAVNGNNWSLQLNASELVPGAHTAYVRQRINGLAASPVVSVAYSISPTVEQTVTSMVTLATANPRSSGGISQYDVTIRNSSTQTIFAPLRIEVASITSASGNVSVANADGGGNGAGAAWEYGAHTGADNALTVNEVSSARTLKFNNPNNEAFTVTYRVIGNLDRGAGGGSAGSSSSGTGGGGSGQSGSNPSTVTSVLHSLTYNPLLNSISSKLLKP